MMTLTLPRNYTDFHVEQQGHHVYKSNRHGLLPEIDFKLTIMMTLLGIKKLSNNAHLIFVHID